jgi:succinate dehydrogenase / fumarate reductase membrane anchor subunit
MDSNFNSFFWIFVYMKGSFIWYTQRYTSIVILSYLIYILSFIFTNQDINFFSWSDFFLSFQVRFLSSIVFLIIVLHAFIGLWTVGTDYLTKRTLGFLNVSLSKRADALRYLYYLIFGLLGIIYLTAILYIIWL